MGLNHGEICPSLLLLHSAAFHKGSTRGVVSLEALLVFLPVPSILAFGYVSVVLSWSGKIV